MPSNQRYLGAAVYVQGDEYSLNGIVLSINTHELRSSSSLVYLGPQEIRHLLDWLSENHPEFVNLTY